MHKRLIYIDNLRLLMIILVVIVHLAMTYSGFDGWYYRDSGQIGPIQMAIFGFFLSFIQGYFMGILFLIAGYFVPDSYDKKGFGRFLKDRFVRLGIPTLLFMLIIDPFINIILDYYHDMRFIDYIKYIISFQFIRGSGPLWFAFTLFIFSIIYAFLRRFFMLNSKIDDQKFPSNPKIIILILLISVFAFLIRIIQPIGTKILNLQLCYFSQYIILFIVGIKCKRYGWFEKLNYAHGIVWLILGMVLGYIIWLTIMLLGGALSGNFDVFKGGLNWQSAAFALWESFVSVSMSIGLLSLFREKFNKQNEIIKTLSDNAFSVYVFHTPIIIILSLLFAHVDMLLIVKFVILVPISIPICFLFSSFIIRKIPFLCKSVFFYRS